MRVGDLMNEHHHQQQCCERKNGSDSDCSEERSAAAISGTECNVKLVVEYDGQAFHGWQYQPGLATVQGELSAVIQMVLRSPPFLLQAAGRRATEWRRCCKVERTRGFMRAVRSLHSGLRVAPISGGLSTP